MDWQITHGQVRGAYLNHEGVEAYVRQDGENRHRWLIFVAGQPIDAKPSNETTARAAAELLVKALRTGVIKADAAGVAAPAG